MTQGTELDDATAGLKIRALAEEMTSGGRPGAAVVLHLLAAAVFVGVEEERWFTKGLIPLLKELRSYTIGERDRLTEEENNLNE